MSFKVIARAPDRDEETFDKIGTALSRTFQLDVTEVAMSLGGDGVKICEVTSFEEARVYAKRVRDLGADSLVLDPTGKVVEQTGSPGARATDDLGSTMMGGYQAPNTPSPAEDDAIDIGFMDKSPGPAPAPGPAPSLPPLDARPEDDLIALDGAPDGGAAPGLDRPAPTSPPPSPGGGAFDNLGDDALVMLDGSVEEAPPPVSLEHGGGAPEDFAPPPEDEVLELDEAPRSYGEGVTAMDAETGEPPQAVAPLSAAEAQAASPADADGDVEWEPAEGEAGPSLVPPRAPPPPMRAATSAITAEKTVTAPGWRGAIQRSRSPLELPRELAREYPRLRIIIGFALVVALGAIGPTCYASSVLDKKVQPLLVDLSTAKAHGQLMMGLPGYRSPEQVQAEIDSITSRHATYAFLMWLVVSGALGFLWFRFVRAE